MRARPGGLCRRVCLRAVIGPKSVCSPRRARARKAADAAGRGVRSVEGEAGARAGCAERGCPADCRTNHCSEVWKGFFGEEGGRQFLMNGPGQKRRQLR
jgi:hypothetical protein